MLKKTSQSDLRSVRLKPPSGGKSRIIGRGLSSLGGQMTLSIPLRAPNGNTQGEILLVKIFDHKVCHRHLLWHLMFRGISLVEWFIIFQKLEFQLKTLDRAYCACLFGVLSRSSSTRKGLDSWTSRTKPIHKWAKSKNVSMNSKLSEDDLLQYLIRKLMIPQKGESIDTLYNVQKIYPFGIKPRELSRIGVGYKDKGSMSNSEIIPEPDSELALEESFEILDLKGDWEKILQLFT